MLKAGLKTPKTTCVAGRIERAVLAVARAPAELAGCAAVQLQYMLIF
jgi:hypothetical protein